MSSRNKRAVKATKGNSVPPSGSPSAPSSELSIVKTISMPQELEKEVQAKRIDTDPEMDWSKHIRRVLRKDLEAPGAEKAQPAQAA